MPSEPNQAPYSNQVPSPVPPQLSNVESDGEPPGSAKDNPTFAFLWLIVGLIALSSTAIFIKLSVNEISAEATVFNRLWIATLAFASWNWLGLGSSASQGQGQGSDDGLSHASRATSTELSRSDQSQLEPVNDSPQNSSQTAIQSDRKENAFTAIQRAVQSWPWLSIGLLFALGLVHLTGRFLWTWSLTRTTAANGAMLANMPPLFTALGGWLFLGQRFDRRFLTGLAISVIGSVVLVMGDWLQPKEALFGVGALAGDAAALTSSVFYAASFLLVEKLRQNFSTPNILVWRCAIGLAIAAPLVLAFDDIVFPISAVGWIAVVGLGLVSEVMGHGLIVYSLKHFSSAFVTIVLLLEPAPVAAVAWGWFGEYLDPLNIAGFFLITLGIYLAKSATGSASASQHSAKNLDHPAEATDS